MISNRRPGPLFCLLFPVEPRSFPGRRGVKIGLRAIHVLFTGVLAGAFVFAVAESARGFWFHGALLSGAALLLLDLHESAAFLCQVRGLVVTVKLTLLALLPWFGAGQPWVLGGLVILSVLFSHAPGSVRYRVLILKGRIQGASSSG